MTETPTGEVEYGGFWIRLWASVIDSALIVFLLGPLMRAVFGPEYLKSTTGVAGPLDDLVGIVLPAVAIVVFWVYKSATPGKMAMHLRIADAVTGNPPTVKQSIGRYLGYYVSMLPFFLGFVMIVFDKRKQGLHDKLAGTVVLRERPKASSA